MKKTALSILFLTFLFSCKDSKVENNSATEVKINTVSLLPSTNEQILTENNGYWVGDFIAKKFKDDKEFVFSNKISINIKGIYKQEAVAESIVAGNVRPMTGIFNKETTSLVFNLKEPGDDKYDGVFKFKIEGDTLSGIWYSNNKQSTVTEREFKLVKCKFVYNPENMIPNDHELIDWYTKKPASANYEQFDEDVYRAASEKVTILNASTTKFNEKMLKNLKKIDLEIIRNTIYARHGLSFKKKTFRQFFDPVNWYIPTSKDVSTDLTPLEFENIVLLKKLEKYATDNYDSFGR